MSDLAGVSLCPSFPDEGNRQSAMALPPDGASETASVYFCGDSCHLTMPPLKIRYCRWIKRSFVATLLMGFCVLGCAPSGYGQDNNVAQLISQLKTRDDRARQNAIDALIAIGMPAVEPLIAFLNAPGHPSEDLAGNAEWGASEALGGIKDPRVVELLVAAVDRKNFYFISHALSTIGAPAVEPLIAAVRDPRAGSRGGRFYDDRFSVAQLGLQDMKDPGAVDPLIAALKDTDVVVRRCATEALGRIKDARAVEPLIIVLNDPGSGVQEEASVALGSIKDPRAISPLIASLNAGYDQHGYEEKVYDNEVSALVEIGSPSVSALIAALKDKDFRVQQGAAAALLEINDPRSVGALRAALKPVIARSYVFLIERGAPASEDLLIEALYKFGNKDMAQDFANCGNAKLEDAAGVWAPAHGYSIGVGGMGGNAAWGRH